MVEVATYISPTEIESSSSQAVPLQAAWAELVARVCQRLFELCNLIGHPGTCVMQRD